MSASVRKGGGIWRQKKEAYTFICLAHTGGMTCGRGEAGSVDKNGGRAVEFDGDNTIDCCISANRNAAALAIRSALGDRNSLFQLSLIKLSEARNEWKRENRR